MARDMERTKRRGCWRALVRDTRGSAMTEGVIILPFLIIVFGCIYWVHARYMKRIQVGIEARACAWAYVNNACEGDPPAGCKIDPGATMTNDDFTAELGESGTSAIEELRNAVGILGPVLDAVFGRDITTTVQAEVPRPQVIGGGSRKVIAQYALVCNEKRRDLLDVVWDIFHDLTGW